MTFCKKVMIQGVLAFNSLNMVINPVFAQYTIPKNFTPFITFTGAVDIINPGKTQYLSLTPPYQDYYTKSNQSESIADWGAFIGVEKPLNETYSWQAGISYYVDSNFSTNGHVWQFGNALFDNFTYQYSIFHQSIMATGKFMMNLHTYKHVHPYVSGEIGVALNKARHYAELPLFSEMVAPQPFESNVQESFVWGVGIGFDYNITQRLRVGAGYQFADAGSVSLGTSADAKTHQSLSFSHLYANQFRLQLTILLF